MNTFSTIHVANDSENFSKTVLESSPDCLKILDKEGKLQYMNYNGMCLMDIEDFSALKDQYWWSLWGKENEELVKNSVKKAMNGDVAQFSAYCPTAKGTLKWWDVTVLPVGTKECGISQILSVSRDITAQKKCGRRDYETE